MSRASYLMCIMGIFGIGIALMLLEIVLSINAVTNNTVVMLIPITFMSTLLVARAFDMWVYNRN